MHLSAQLQCNGGVVRCVPRLRLGCGSSGSWAWHRWDRQGACDRCAPCCFSYVQRVHACIAKGGKSPTPSWHLHLQTTMHIYYKMTHWSIPGPVYIAPRWPFIIVMQSWSDASTAA